MRGTSAACRASCTSRPATPVRCKTIERRIDDGYAPIPLVASRAGRVGHATTSTGPGWRTRASTSRRPASESEHVILGMPAEAHQTTWCAEKACDFMRARAEDGQPWLFSVNIFDPHHAFDPPASVPRTLPGAPGRDPAAQLCGRRVGRQAAYQAYDHDGAYGHAAGFPYDEMSDRPPPGARRLLGHVRSDRRAGGADAGHAGGDRPAENTIVIFTSDHGEMLGDHGIYLKGPFFYEPAIHVPLIVSWPGQIAPQRSAAWSS